MKTTIYNLTIAAAIMVGGIFTGCDSSAQKVDDAQADVQEAKQDLKSAQNKANEQAEKEARDEEWRIFKADAEVKIANNESRISELRGKINSSGKTMSSVYENRIKTLEDQNKELRNRIYSYESNQSDWEVFKREFNRDMDALGTALKDFGSTN
jgi:outer membrane murein-binding lipoprotein Lpp